MKSKKSIVLRLPDPLSPVSPEILSAKKHGHTPTKPEKRGSKRKFEDCEIQQLDKTLKKKGYEAERLKCRDLPGEAGVGLWGFK